MSGKAYRLNAPITVVIRDERRYRLVELPAGSIVLAANWQPDANGMIDGTCKGNSVLLFLRDLEERAEPIAAKKPAAQVLSSRTIISTLKS